MMQRSMHKKGCVLRKLEGKTHGKKRKISWDFQGQICGKIGQFHGIFTGKKSKYAQKSADFAGEKSKFAEKSANFAGV